MSDVAKTPREELECEKKYLYEHSMFWECNDGSKCQILEDDVVRLLNEQQATIDILLEELVNAQQQGYVVNFLHKNEHCSLIPKELEDE